MNQRVRVRFAPSPTGQLHIGGVRTALFNYLFAKKEKGSFLLRIEDTDRERSKTEYEDEILDSMKWLGLVWDEDIKKQSERLDLYASAVSELLQKGLAYVDEEVTQDGPQKAVKLKVPQENVVFHDLVHGKIEFPGKDLGDFVIRKSDGFPTYHLASVVDDHQMQITHVIRGDDHISNTPRHLLIYRSLGWEPPAFAHLPLVFGSDRKPLSKRTGTVSVSSYRDQGYLPGGLLNYLALLGWSAKDDREILSLQELEEKFNIEGINGTNACFDFEKLRWLNSEHIRRLTEAEYVNHTVRYVEKVFPDQEKEKVEKISLLFRERISTFQDLLSQADYFFRGEITYDESAVCKHLSKPETSSRLTAWKNTLDEKGDFSSAEALESLLRETAERLKIHARELIHPTRVAVTGRAVSPGIFDVLVLLGKAVVLKRMQYVIMHFGKKTEN